MSKKRMSNKEAWLPSKDGKSMIPANRAARRALQKIKGGGLPPPIQQPKKDASA